LEGWSIGTIRIGKEKDRGKGKVDEGKGRWAGEE